MQAFRLKERNGIDSLELVHEEIPSFDKHEVLIKIKSVALNFRDIGVANGQYPFPVKDHVVPCSDACGEVVEVGDCVQGLSKGDLVVGTFDPTNLYGQQKDWNNGLGGPVDGVLREFIALPSSSVVKVPSNTGLSTAHWASVVCTGVTAWNSLYANIPLRPGQIVLFIGMQDLM
jgi:NADPH:quinone reductase-like Zn-dependent oxidoreductase